MGAFLPKADITSGGPTAIVRTGDEQTPATFSDQIVRDVLLYGDETAGASLKMGNGARGAWV